MAGLIFPNSSYFLSFGAGTHDRVVHAFASRARCRIYASNNPTISDDTVEGLLQRMYRKMGCFIFADEIAPATRGHIVARLEAHKVPALWFTSGALASNDASNSARVRAVELPATQSAGATAEATAEAIDAALSRFVAELIPSRLGELAVQSANMVFPTFFKGVGAFAETPNPIGAFERQLTFNSVGGDLMGLCSVKVSLKALSKKWPDTSIDQATGDLKESGNQFLGVIAQFLAKIGVNMRIGLPTLFDLQKIPEVQTLVYFPSVHVTDPDGAFLVSLGYANLKNGALFDLSGVDFAPPSDEIEML